MKKILSLILLLLILPSVFADGVIIRPDGDFVKEHSQFAVINYENGLQKMVIATQVDYVDEKSVWLFPVPALPNDVVIDIVPNVPRLYGSSILDEARRNVEQIFENIRMSQLYTFFFGRHYVVYEGLDKAVGERVLAGVEVGQSVQVIEHIEKEGMITELVTAKDGAALRLYLVNKGFELPHELISVLRDYSDQDYSYVVSWLAEKPVYDENFPQIMPFYRRNVGVEIMFPTDKIYFPMLPTSVYGSEKIPADIYILGLYTPQLYDRIEQFTTTRYFKQYGYPSFYYEMKDFFGDISQEGMDYTLVQVNDAPSKYLEDDLWFEPGAPSNVNFASSVVDITRNNKTSLSFIALALISLLTSFITSLIFFKSQWKKFTLIGLANVLSIIAVVIAVLVVKSRRIDPALKSRLKQQGVLAITSDFGRKLGFVITFSILFLILSWILENSFTLIF